MVVARSLRNKELRVKYLRMWELGRGEDHGILFKRAEAGKSVYRIDLAGDIYSGKVTDTLHRFEIIEI